MVNPLIACRHPTLCRVPHEVGRESYQSTKAMQAQATGVPPPGSRYGTAASAAIVTIGAHYQGSPRAFLHPPSGAAFAAAPPVRLPATARRNCRLVAAGHAPARAVRPARGHRCAGRAERSERSAAGKLRPAIELLDSTPPLPPALFKLCLWTAQYYQHSLGDTLSWALPVLLRQGEPAEARLERYWHLVEGANPDDPRLSRARVSAKP